MTILYGDGFDGRPAATSRSSRSASAASSPPACSARRARPRAGVAGGAAPGRPAPRPFRRARARALRHRVPPREPRLRRRQPRWPDSHCCERSGGSANEKYSIYGQDARPLMLVCSSGGHLLQMQELREAWEPFERVWVTFDKSDARSLLRDERVIARIRPDQPQHPEPAAQPAARLDGVLRRSGRRRSSPPAPASPSRSRGSAGCSASRVVYVESFTRIDGPVAERAHDRAGRDAAVRPVARARAQAPRGRTSPATSSSTTR